MKSKELIRWIIQCVVYYRFKWRISIYHVGSCWFIGCSRMVYQCEVSRKSRFNLTLEFYLYKLSLFLNQLYDHDHDNVRSMILKFMMTPADVQYKFLNFQIKCSISYFVGGYPTSSKMSLSSPRTVPPRFYCSTIFPSQVDWHIWEEKWMLIMPSDIFWYL